ncbi:PREDICTED: uncharacterized protein LOC108558534 [Nicrophorus vespilloides]|uniref:Uncharacterized protein LOC108558534 n=1 Tax=Nicrophorus vespilloides TaxID=110193 RepID=A0ABM1M8Q9_NICVS|nr:PREDICTED: uncharacterized protein LOC108558534 [Nicrophorus vespilloides]
MVIAVGSNPIIQEDFDVWSDNITSSNNNRIPKVLNFFPIPVEEECKANDGRRTGVCMNTYECRMQGGTSHGSCALGFGVCCVFKATCNQDVFNNLTYFVNPHFPDLTHSMSSNCELKVKKIDPEIAQIRLDFIHFNLGQPNRRTGVCEEDTFVMAGGNATALTMCGLNSGQHVFFDVENVNEAISINMVLGKRSVSRLWEVRITQIPFAQRAPIGCLQYHTGPKGRIQTLNFADNGRRLANQDYNICTRQETGMCSIAYEPCDDNSFRIGPNPIDGTSAINLNQMGVVNDPMAAAATMSGGTSAGTQAGSTAADMGDLQDVGSGDGADIDMPSITSNIQSRMMEICTDKIVMPCDSEDLLMPVDSGTGFCSLAHCGSSLCPNGESPCRVESSVTPFTIGVQFGPSARDDSPEDNLGMCLNYEQLPCLV